MFQNIDKIDFNIYIILTNYLKNSIIITYLVDYLDIKMDEKKNDLELSRHTWETRSHKPRARNLIKKENLK